MKQTRTPSQNPENKIKERKNTTHPYYPLIEKKHKNKGKSRPSTEIMHLTPLLLTSGIPKMIRPAMRPDILRHSLPGYLGCPQLLGTVDDGTTSQTTERVV